MTDVQIAIAVAMWKTGLDTYEIASKLQVEESAVYNRLHLIRGGP